MSYRSVFKPGLFNGQTVIVTGGGSGIGRCTAHEIAALGAHVVITGRKPDKLATVEQLLENLGYGESATLTRPDGNPVAVLVSLAPPMQGAPSGDWMEKWNALAQRIGRAWTSDKSAVDLLSEMRR